LDDILIYSQTKEEYLRYLKMVLSTLHEKKVVDYFEEIQFYEVWTDIFGIYDIWGWFKDRSIKGPSNSKLVYSKKCVWSNKFPSDNKF
jgi:hypothetical protein